MSGRAAACGPGRLAHRGSCAPSPSAPPAASDEDGSSSAIRLRAPGEGELLADLLDRGQGTVPWLQASEELLHARQDGASEQVRRECADLPTELAGLVEVAFLGEGHR